jgi:hypothetical protein
MLTKSLTFLDLFAFDLTHHHDHGRNSPVDDPDVCITTITIRLISPEIIPSA